MRSNVWETGTGGQRNKKTPQKIGAGWKETKRGYGFLPYLYLQLR
jgi:hypothetical protein